MIRMKKQDFSKYFFSTSVSFALIFEPFFSQFSYAVSSKEIEQVVQSQQKSMTISEQAALIRKIQQEKKDAAKSAFEAKKTQGQKDSTPMLMLSMGAASEDPSSQQAGQSSNANNFAMPARVNVNDRTGGLSMQLPVASISAINQFSIDFTLQYSDENQDQTNLGLPNGWNYAWLSYIGVENGVRLHMTGGQSYEILNPDTAPTLKDYKLDDIKISLCDSSASNPNPDPVGCKYKLITGISPLTPKGMLTQYFNDFLMISMQDNNKNKIEFSYERQPNHESDPSDNVGNTRLSSVTDSMGLKYTFTYDDLHWNLALPNGNSYSLLVENDGNNGTRAKEFALKPVGLSAQKTLFDYSGSDSGGDRMMTISSPTGGLIKISYGKLWDSDHQRNAYCLSFETFPCIDPSTNAGMPKAVVSSIQTSPNSSAPATTVSYDFNINVDDQIHNYTGYPDVDATGTQDNTIHDATLSNYIYKVTIDNGVSVTTKTFNHLHLERLTEMATKASNRPILNVNTVYPGTNKDDLGSAPPADNLPANYQTPTEVYTNTYDQTGSYVEHKKTMSYDNYGKTWHTSESELQRDSTGKLIPGSSRALKDTYLFYDVAHRKQVIDEIDQTAANNDAHKVMRTVSTVDDFGNVVLDQQGFVAYQPGFYSGLSLDNLAKQTISSPGFIAGEMAKRMDYVYSDDSNSPVINGRKLHLLISKALRFDDANTHTNSPSTQVTQYGYSQSGNSITVSTSVGDGTNMIKSSKIINANIGLVMSEITPLGYATTYTYDGLGRKLSETSPMGIKTTYAYQDDPNGDNVVTTTAPGPYITEDHYDGMGRETYKKDNRLSGELNHKFYNNLNQLIREKDAYGRETVYTYDDQGRPWTTKDGISNTKTYGYNAKDQIKSTCMNGYLLKIDYLDDTGSVTASTDFPGAPVPDNSLTNCPTVGTLANNTAQKSSVVYNGFGQISSMFKIAPDGTVLATIWDFKYDIDGNKTHQLWKGWDDILVETDWKYDLFGNELTKNITYTPKESLNPQKGTADVKTYDVFNRLTRETNPMGAFKEYTYDNDGNMLTMMDYAKTVFHYAYNKDGKMTDKNFTDPKTQSTTHYKYAYDSTTGKPTSVMRDDGRDLEADEINYAYNQFGDLVKIIYKDGNTLEYTYDGYGRVNTLKDINQTVTTYAYNDTEHSGDRDLDPSALAAVTRATDSVVYNYIKDSTDLNKGQIQDFTTGGVKTSYVYYGPYAADPGVKSAPNNFGNIKEVKVTDAADANKIIQDINYKTHDAMGNITSVTYSSTTSTDENTNFTDEYTYNSLNQLVLSKHIKTKTPSEWTLTNYAYDANANVISNVIRDQKGTIQSSKSFLFDADNKIVSVTTN